MAVKFEKIKDGMTLYDRHRHRMGNTTIRAIVEWQVHIIEVSKDTKRRGATASWNGNRPEWWPEHRLTKLHTWSMNDDGVEVKRNLLGGVVSVKKVRTPKAGTSAA